MAHKTPMFLRLSPEGHLEYAFVKAVCEDKKRTVIYNVKLYNPLAENGVEHIQNQAAPLAYFNSKWFAPGAVGAPAIL